MCPAGRAADLRGADIEVPMVVNGEPQYQLVLQVGARQLGRCTALGRCPAALVAALPAMLLPRAAPLPCS